jgi:beta-lactam-binding protein with PASTA domain
MAKSFTITTTATDTLKADATGHAEAVFTVTNATARPVRGMARAKALADSKKEWLSIAGETERDFGGGATEQFTVNFDAAGAPAGKYPFRLDVASAINPDEDFTEGQTVTVEVAGAAAPAAPKKGFPKWIFIPIAVVVLLIIGVVVWLLIPDKPGTHQLSDVANTLENDARQLLESECKEGEGCVTVEISNVSDNTVAKGLAIRTEPAAGTEVTLGSNVTLFISTGAEAPGKVTILNVANQPAEKAKDLLEKSCSPAPCLDVEINRISDNKVPQGMVIRTEPGAGTQVNAGSKVAMFVSAGTDEVAIPSVRNRPAADARKLLEGQCKPSPCLKVVVTEKSDDEVGSGRAIGTDPAKGSLKIGSSIVLFVSTGPELKVVGHYLGLSEQEARQRIVNDGFVVGTVTRVPSPFASAKVVVQKPKPPAKRTKGARIDLTVLGSQ